MNTVNQKQIAKNTILLYVRMGAMLLVSLYTSSVILNALGEIDMGIYNAVGGIVTMFSFLSGTMTVACQRFFAQEIGKNNYQELKHVFSLCVTVFIVIALLVVILSETVGLWFLYHKAQTAGRMEAAKWVFQLSIISFIFTIVRTPYQGIIIIKEKMKVFTYLSIAEVLCNLGVALVIDNYSNDRLILYAVLMMLVNLIISLYYYLYCNRFYEECKYSFWWKKDKFLEIFGFAGWNMIGALSGICKSQGLNMLLNMFFGPAVNAARAMAYKVFTTVQLFADNFFTAVKPQILKSYSSGNTPDMLKLVMQSSKFSYYLLFLVSLPILLETQPILDVWLKKVPDYTALFTRLVVINALIEVLANPLAVSMQAYGKIRNYHLNCGSFTLTILPISYILLKMHYPPESVFYVSIIICAIAIWIRAVFVKHSVGLSLKQYFIKTILPILAVTLITTPLPLYLEMTINSGLNKFLLVGTVSVLMTSLSVLTVGMTGTERKHFFETVQNAIRRNRHEHE